MDDALPRPGPRWRRPAVIGAAVAAVLLIAGVVALVGGDSDGGPEPTRAPTTTTPVVAPLTGLVDTSGRSATRPALTVKVGNNPEARPQRGLDAADLVVEEEVEGGITRFLAVFQSQVPEAVGPVRSVRYVDADIVASLGGLFAYSGGTPPNVERIRSAPVESFDETEAGDAMFLDSTFSTGQRPNILFVRPEALWARSASRTPPAPQLRYLAGASFGGTPVTSVTVPVGSAAYTPTWRWDETKGVWLRFYGDEAQTTASGEQLSADILLVQFSSAGGETSVLGEGEAAVLADGRIVRGRWSRSRPEEPTRFLDAAGRPIEVPPGRAWLALPAAGGELGVVPR